MPLASLAAPTASHGLPRRQQRRRPLCVAAYPLQTRPPLPAQRPQQQQQQQAALWSHGGGFARDKGTYMFEVEWTGEGDQPRAQAEQVSARAACDMLLLLLSARQFDALLCCVADRARACCGEHALTPHAHAPPPPQSPRLSQKMVSRYLELLRESDVLNKLRCE
jgi:hypothetical protein